jgi:hypothetical protein
MSVAQNLGIIRGTWQSDESTDTNFELEFRREVAQLIHDLLRRNYVAQPEAARLEAEKRCLTVEQLIASSIAYHVMNKVDEEYL